MATPITGKNTAVMSPVHFLLVDDLEDNLVALEALLRRDDLVLLRARSGEEALELLLIHDVALGLLDVQMPGMDGFELAELMRGNERTRHVPIIFLTASNTDSQRKFRGYEAGAVDFIQKPVEWDILRSKTKVFFDLHRQKQQLAAQRDELEVYAETLTRSDRYKDQFLAILAHELRNPLTPLRMGLDVLRGQPSPERTEQIHGVMDRQLVHLVRLVDDLLDVSRVSQGKIVLKREKVEIAEIVQSALEASQPFVEGGNHTLRVNTGARSLWVNGDKTRLTQVVANLLNNAAKYTPTGGTLTLDTYRDDQDVVIAVSDNGMGIPKAMQSNIFELFTQVGEHLTRSQGGLGIGLALVKQLVSMHEGSISVSSDGENKGSTFAVRLPLLVVNDEEASERTVTDPGTNGGPLSILVVDDNADIAETFGWLLSDMGHEYRIVLDGRTALEAAREFRPDVVLLDIGMPSIDGYAVCRAFRDDPGLRYLPIIAQTGWGQEADKAATARAGFDYHLVKPVGYGELQQALAFVMHADRAQAG
ncbi:response regulator [Luteibacter sp. dw_328]|uniref:response regulator n=1 Tax=Luteibacter sp. dw_328 TaxID=2719796 RepID=UPI001BD293EA|nr:response regulator [Luteibacter sp. dw_328]